jgi:hypothetical protein
MFLMLLIICCTNKKPTAIKPAISAITKLQTKLKKHQIDTTLTKEIFIPTIKDTQTLICHLFGNSWKERIYWTTLIITHNDTLFTSSDSSSFLDWYLQGTSSLNKRDSIVNYKKNWLLTNMTNLYLDTVNISDDRRILFKNVSLSKFTKHFQNIGYSEKQIADVHSFFWEYYKDKNIYMIGIPNSNPPEDERAYAFDPYTKKIIQFYN